MKVAEVCGLGRSSGGLFYAITALCRAMQRTGLNVSVYGKDEPGLADDRPAWGTIPTQAYAAYGPLQISPQLLRLLKTASPELLHQHGIWLGDQWAGLHWQKKTGRPVVISPHGMLDGWALKNSAWKKKLVGNLFANRSLHEATCLHALCRSELEAIRAYGLKNPVALIPNGIELPTLGNPHGGDGSKKLLFLGRIHPKKGINELLRAWSRISSDWNLVIAGWDDGGHEASLKTLSNELGLGGSVEFVGSKYGEEKDQLLREVDAFILPSFSEGLPMSVLEAWSYGLPVVMTDFCNLPEGFAAEAALHIEPNPDSIFQGLETLAVMDDAALDTMGSNGRKLVEEKFTWPGIAANMCSVYEWCLKGGTPPDCMELFDG